MKITTKTCCIILALLALLFTGCRHRPQHLTQNFGESSKAVFSRQVINPEAPKDYSPVNTIPGTIGNQIYHKRYVKSLTEEKKSDDSLSQELSDMD